MGVQVPLLQVKVSQGSATSDVVFSAQMLSLSVVSPAAWQLLTAWTTGAAASGVRPLFSSVTRPVTDRVVPSRSMVPVGLACLVAVMIWSKGGLLNCPSVLGVEVTFQPFMVKVLEESGTLGCVRLVGSAVTSP